MVPIVYVGPFDAVTTADGTTFPNGAPVECDPELAAALVKRPDFRPAEAKKENSK